MRVVLQIRIILSSLKHWNNYSRHYLSERNKNGEQDEQMGRVKWETSDLKRKQPSRLEVIGAVISLGVLGFWFGIGAALGAKMVNSLEELISR